MNKLKVVLMSILILIAGVCVAGGDISRKSLEVYATINDDASISLGNVYDVSKQTSAFNYSALGTYALYDDNADTTKAMYTTKITNKSSIDADSFISTVLSTTYGSTLVVNVGSATGTSNRLPWLSHSFSISENLLKASQRGYLDIGVSSTNQIDNSSHASASVLRTVLYNGTLTDVDSINVSTYNMSTISGNSNATLQNVTLSDCSSGDYMLVYAMNRTGSWATSRTMNMTIMDPMLTISSSDKNAPSVEFSTNSNWSDGSKVLTITIRDNESGIMSVTSSSGTLNLDNSNSSDELKVYTMDMPTNGEYSVSVQDNVGNYQTYIYTESKIDKVAPNALTVEMPSYTYTNSFELSVSFVSDGLSAETIYYTLDGTIPNVSSNILVVGKNIIELAQGKTTINIVVIDEVGHIGEIYTNSIQIRRCLNIETSQCSYELIKPTTYDGDTGENYFDGETIRLNFIANEGCVRKVIKINGNEMVLADDYYEFVANGDISIEVVYVYVLKVLDYVDAYTFNPYVDSQEISFEMNMENLSDINVKITKNGVDAEPFGVGNYVLEWSYSDYEIEGSGSFEFVINPLDIYVSVVEGQFKIYGEDDKTLAYEIEGVPEFEVCDLTIKRYSGEDVGSYGTFIESHNISDNYNINFYSQDYSIRARKLVVVADTASKIFGESDDVLTYKFYESSLIGDDVLTGALERESGENVGSYEIKLGTLSNSNYEILFLGANMTIVPKEISIEIDDIECEYGDEKPLTFTSVEDIDMQMMSGSLVRTGGKDVGVYSIGIGSLNSANYKIKVIKNGRYTIYPKLINISAKESFKVYGDIDVLDYEAEGLCEGDALIGTLARNEGENVGVYEINLGTLHNNNYIINFTPNYLTITPVGLVVDINNCEQVYGQLDQELSCVISGVKFDDEVVVGLYRESGDSVGEYVINVEGVDNENYYILEANVGTYSIIKANIVPTIDNVSYTYSGSVINIETSSFPFDLTYIYKQNGIVVDGMLNAGVYQVQAIFAGNDNYNPSKSVETDIVVEKQSVYLTLAENKFIYDGNVKFPEFTYDMSCNLDINKISFKFENDIRPIEVGTYNFSIVTTDDNYFIDASGVLVIASALSITNSNNSVIECEEATFDNDAQDIVLVEEAVSGKFNDQEIISSCTFDNVVADDDHIYTIRIKANSDAENVYVYQLGENNAVRQIVVTNDGGYYVFKVDNLTDTYLITKDVEPLPMWFWLAIIGGVVAVMFIVLRIVKVVKKNKRVTAETSNMDTYNLN